MKYLLDTDHLSILQRKAGKDYQNLSRRMAELSAIRLYRFDNNLS
jgi:hypothetical protein